MSKFCGPKKEKIDIKYVLKEAGFSATKTKLEILEIVQSSNSPLSSLDEGFNRYEIAPNNHHHHHIKCNDCGETSLINKCDLDVFTKQPKKLGYKNITHKIEFFGTCKACF